MGNFEVTNALYFSTNSLYLLINRLFQLIRVVGYDLRKKIRSQIRLVKKLISENTLETYISSRQVTINKVKEDTKTTHIRKQDIKSPERPKEDKDLRHPSRSESKKDTEVTQYDSTHIRKTPERGITERTRQHAEITERRESTYSYDERRTSSDYTTTTKVTRRSQTPEKSSQKGTPRGMTPENTTPSKISTDVKSNKTETKDTLTKLKKSGTVSPKPAVVDDKPEWVKQRNLRKTSETSAPVGRKTTTTSKVTSTRSETVRSSPAKEIKPTDIITSSYGVGPTDENGTPLFGLKALRAQSKGKVNNHDFFILHSVLITLVRQIQCVLVTIFYDFYQMIIFSTCPTKVFRYIYTVINRYSIYHIYL